MLPKRAAKANPKCSSRDSHDTSTFGLAGALVDSLVNAELRVLIVNLHRRLAPLLQIVILVLLVQQVSRQALLLLLHLLAVAEQVFALLDVTL